jgi:hypothetical protein
MDWNELIDRDGNFEFVRVSKPLSRLYFPEDIQSLVDTHGVRAMVVIVNEQYQARYKRFALQITNNGGELKVIPV